MIIRKYIKRKTRKNYKINFNFIVSVNSKIQKIKETKGEEKGKTLSD